MYYATKVLMNEHQNSMKNSQNYIYNRGHMNYFSIKNTVYGIAAICN
jgi:hypothetical protein